MIRPSIECEGYRKTRRKMKTKVIIYTVRRDMVTFLFKQAYFEYEFKCIVHKIKMMQYKISKSIGEY